METYTAAYGSKNSRQKSYERNSVGGQGGVNGSANHASSRNRSRIDNDDEIVAPIRSVRTGEGAFHHDHHAPPRSQRGNKNFDGPGEEGSIESVRSDKHIIRKDVQWHVGYEARAI